jgi:hypothetical protein
MCRQLSAIKSEYRTFIVFCGLASESLYDMCRFILKFSGSLTADFLERHKYWHAIKPGRYAQSFRTSHLELHKAVHSWLNECRPASCAPSLLN